LKKGVIYARYSSDNQTEQSIEGQLRVCYEFAEKNKIEILATYIDRAMTGTNDNRPDFKKMLVDSKTNRWDCVLVYKFDRFSRNKYESVIHKKALKDVGTKVISAMEDIPDTPEGIILESLLEGLNQYYSAELSQKVKRGMRESRMKGLFHGGFRPYGYNIENHRLEINPAEAKIIKIIFKEYSLGLKSPIIAKKLNRRCLKYRDNKKFTSETVSRLLNKEYYTGIYKCNDEYFCDIYPAIINRELYKKVRILKSRNKYGSKEKHIFEYKNKLFCKICGSYFTSDGGTSRHGTRHRYYKCVTKRKFHTCESETFNKIYFENYLTNCIKSFISNKYNIGKLSKILLSRYKDHKNVNLIKEYEDEILRCKNSLQNLCFAVEQGIVTDSTNNRILSLEDRVRELQAEITIEKNKLSYKQSIPFIRNFYKKALSLESIMFVYYIVNKIEIDKDEIDIYLEIPYSDKFTETSLISTINYNQTISSTTYNKKINFYI